MNFIFPKNYNFKNKFLGFIDYPTIFLNIIWDSIIFLIINLFFKSLHFKIFLFIYNVLCTVGNFYTLVFQEGVC